MKTENNSKNKIAQGHIEVMLSFTLFVGFLLFIFIFLNPFAKTESNQIMNNVQEGIINNITGEIGKLSIIVENPGGCYDFDTSEYPGNYLEVQDINENRKFTIYFNNIFNNQATSKVFRCTDNYKLGIYSKEKIIIYEKIQELKSNYANNYESLKASLGILNEFTFELKRIDGGVELSADRAVPAGIEVESVNIPMRVINSKGIISEYILNIRAW